MIGIIKLLSGDTLVAKVETETNSHIYVTDPLALQIVNNPAFGPAMMTTFWIPLEELPITIDIRQEHVIMMCSCPDDTANFYKDSLKKIKGIRSEEHIDANYRKFKQAILAANNTFH